MAENLGLLPAFRGFCDILASEDSEALSVAAELADYYQTSHAKAYFPELLQAAGDPAARKQRGVYYTPGPVVDFLVRRVEELIPEGPLRIVDPACGTGVFLLSAAELAPRRPGSSLVGFDVSDEVVEVAKLLLGDAGVPICIQQVNPLIAGDDLADLLLEGSSALVILGNPPYANYGRLNRGVWIDALTADYRRGVREQKLNLTDDFIKFLRWGQYWLDRAGRGVLAMITSRTYLSGVTHCGMRRSLAESFSQFEIVDLHGDGEPGDENIFPIRRGVAIGVFSKPEREYVSPKMTYRSLQGARSKKLAAVQRSVTATYNPSPAAPDWLFVPPAEVFRSGDHYFSWPRLDEIFAEFVSGVQTKNDALFVDIDRHVLVKRISQYISGRGLSFDESLIQPYVVGPFDRRWVYYDPQLLGRARWPVMRHLVQIPNVALVFMRQSTAADRYDHALIVDALASDRVFYSRRGAPFVAPLWLSEERASNLNEGWVDTCAERLGCRPDDASLFAWLYAILHAPSYRRDNLAGLQRDFPRIPWPDRRETFDSAAMLGKRLIELHLSTCGDLAPLHIVGDSDSLIIERGYPRLHEGLVSINRRTALQLNDPSVWEFHTGGHRVIERWLKVRQGRRLNNNDLRFLAGLSEIAKQTAALSTEIDVIYASSYRRSPRGSANKQ